MWYCEDSASGLADASGPRGSVGSDGYWCTPVDGKFKKVHRIVWELHHGPIPDDMQVDHINGIRTDNRIVNLRLATPAENRRNAKMRTDNTVGVKAYPIVSAKTGS